MNAATTLPALLAGMGQNIAHEVHPATLPGHAICILPERSAAAPGLVTRPRSTTPVEIRKIAQLASMYEWQ
jgi:LysR family hydrogen peroxide-inducible transcriptional activator